jgi:hypothetical protein
MCENEGKTPQSQEISKSLIADAAAEQTKSQGAEDGLEKGKRGTIATPQQMFGSRRRLDDIVLEMIKDWTPPKKPDATDNQQDQSPAGKSSKSNTHRGGRSVESLFKRANRK